MNNNIKIGLTTVVVILTVLLNGCETTELDVLDDPNNVNPEEANPDFLINQIQLDFNSFIGQVNGIAMDYSRMTHLFGEYFFDPAGLNTAWRLAYADVFEDTILLESVAEEREFYTHAGAGQVMRAYTLVTLVDLFGKVPFSEANDVSILNPKVDEGEDVYAGAMVTLDEAISNLSIENAPPIQEDLYFGDNSRQNWLKLANSLKLKMLVQTRLVNEEASRDGINDLLNEPDLLIENENEDFAFQYLTVSTPNDSRHPSFVANYNNGSTSFMSNNYMNILKSSDDPRLRYYFYRQRTLDPPNNDLPCIDLELELCYIGDGYYGRDHGDGSFTTNGMFNRNTTWGAYPVGGRFDDNSADRTNPEDGGQGEGIRPLLLSSFVEFMKAEAALTLGTVGNAREYLENGIRKSIDKVIPFGDLNENSDTDFTPSQDEIDNFVNTILNEYDDPANSEIEKLDIIITQYHIALWGNGIEAYNNYRRTGLPSAIQGTQVILSTGAFPRVLQYPARTVTLNNNISQQNITNQVFWDNNDENFID
ncbi:SusD/RagB family nutrient-binding outer membrane lipoprotein [Gangjinia marincola]